MKRHSNGVAKRQPFLERCLKFIDSVERLLMRFSTFCTRGSSILDAAEGPLIRLALLIVFTYELARFMVWVARH
jgi:hypothetical protein